ncbi:MAG TPA: DUF2585 domain-containing protein [Allosphingosinicella sp.]|nr:DUF2585 domain-containing protein [Allosphingosinicella sp.]
MVKQAGSMRITGRHMLVAALVIVMTAVSLHAMGRPLICTCGTVKLWGGTAGGDNSQHLADWYSLSHVIHGFLFYALGWLFLRRNPMGERLVAAVTIESLWEILENSRYIIDRYREATIALGYTGDSVINSLSDIGWMILGFLAARRLSLRTTIVLAIALELVALWAVRDNLTLNVLMLVWPIDAIKHWQAG